MTITTELRFKNGKRRTSVLKAGIRLVLIALLLAFALGPFLWMLRTAFSPSNQAYQQIPTLLPKSFTLSNFQAIFESTTNPFVTQLENTIIVAVCSTFISLMLGLSGAYALARFRFRGRSSLSVGILLIQLLPSVLLVIPIFVVLNNLNLENSLTGLIVAYTTINLPFSIWILKGYLQALPSEIEDAARVDGCTHFGTLIRIVLPSMAPALVAVATLAFVNAWNEYLLPLVLVNDPNKQVLGVGLTSYVSQFSSDLPGLFAMATLTSLPVVLLFIILQQRLVSGLSAGAIK
jgi:ABC-type glycerol-3-phosphate transport system permease component